MTVYRPRGRICTVAEPGSAAVSLADLKAHLRVQHDDDDALITAHGAAAVDFVERQLQRNLVIRQVVLQLPGLPAGKVPVELPRGAVSVLTSVVADGVTLTDMTVAGDSPALLLPEDDWPVVAGDGLPVVVTYTAGFAVLPPAIAVAIKMSVAAVYDDPETGMATAPVLDLLAPFRIAAL